MGGFGDTGHWLHSPCTSPGGCLLGVIIGWCTGNLPHGQGVIQWTEDTIEEIVSFVLTPARELKKMKMDFGGSIKVFHFCLYWSFWVLRSPIIFKRWLAAHPVNRAYAVMFLAGVTYLAVNALWMVPGIPTAVRFIDDNNHADSFVIGLEVLSIFLGGTMTVIVTILIPLVYFEEYGDRKPMAVFYSTWEEYSRGALRFYCKQLGFAFLTQARMLLAMFTIAFWFTGVGLAFLLFIVLPIAAGVGLTKGIFQVATRGGHWLCFGVTLFVTTFAAWATYGYLEDPRALWTTALFAGLTSAIATETLRRSMVAFFLKYGRAQIIVLQSIEDQLKPAFKGFWTLTTATGNFCFKPVVG